MSHTDPHPLPSHIDQHDLSDSQRAGHIDPIFLRALVAEGASVHLRARMATSALPILRNRRDIDLVTKKAWKDSCVEHSSTTARSCASLSPTSDELYALGLQVSGLYQELEQIARELVLEHYGFKDPALESSPERASAVIRSNQDLYYMLKLGYNFLHHGYPERSHQPGYKYHHPILQDFICQAWFGDAHNSPGLVVERRFDRGRLGIPQTTIAFVMTAISRALFEWQTGTHQKTHFLLGDNSEATYYNFLTHISDWEAYTTTISQNYGIFRKLIFLNVSQYAVEQGGA